MKNAFYYLALCTACFALLSSCATLFNGQYTKVSIHSQDSLSVHYNRIRYTGMQDLKDGRKGHSVTLNVKRQNKPVEFVALNGKDSLLYSIKSKFNYVSLANIYTWGVGFFVDFANGSIRTYPRHIYLNNTSALSQKYALLDSLAQDRIDIGSEINYYNPVYIRNKEKQKYITRRALGRSMWASLRSILYIPHPT